MVLTSVRQRCPRPLAPACGALGAGDSGRRAWELGAGTRCWARPPGGTRWRPGRQQVLCSHAEVEGGPPGGSGLSAPNLLSHRPRATWTCRSWARRSPPRASEDPGADQVGPACQPGVWGPAGHPCPATASPPCSALSLPTPSRLCAQQFGNWFHVHPS